jgi:endonuclease YncB( thermonuclease family)
VAFRPGFTPAQTLILGLVVLLIIAALGLAVVLLFFSPPPTAPAVQPSGVTPVSLPSPTLSIPPAQTPLPSVSPAPSATPLPQACLPPDGERSQARVTAVLDGATIQAEVNGHPVTVRYLGVDPPGPGAAAGSTALNRSLVEGQTVDLVKDIYDSDAQGRLLRYVLAGDVFVNYVLVRQGDALAALYPPGISCAETLVAADRLARAERLGFWASAPQAALPATPTSAAAGGATQRAPCDCNRTYSCSDFASQSSAQACYNACGDYRNAGLDADHNGLACENLP